MLRHRLHCKIERAETDMYLTGAPSLCIALYMLSSVLVSCCLLSSTDDISCLCKFAHLCNCN